IAGPGLVLGHSSRVVQELHLAVAAMPGKLVGTQQLILTGVRGSGVAAVTVSGGCRGGDCGRPFLRGPWWRSPIRRCLGPPRRWIPGGEATVTVTVPPWRSAPEE